MKNFISHTKLCAALLSLGALIVILTQCKKEVNNDTGNNNSPGHVVFWTQSDFGYGDISVVCNGSTKTITAFFSGGIPDCGAQGAATFDLDPGTYDYSASCSRLTWNGSITVTAGNCLKLQLTSNGGGGSGQAMFWTQSDLGCGNINVTCNGVTKTISTYYSGRAPTCGAPGTATFNLSPGTYNYSASCSGLTWDGNITVTGNGCSKLQLVR